MSIANTATDKATIPTQYSTLVNRRRSCAPIRADDPAAQEKLTTRIAALEASKNAMKDINAALRLKAVVTGNERLRALGMDDAMIAKARETIPMFKGWEMQNLNQNIARLRKRLEEVAAEVDRTPAEDVEGEGYRVVENADLNRIQIIFDAKPDADIRAILKRNGFRWAPSKDAWQRHLNDNGRCAAKRVLRDLKPA